ncbi:MAG: HEPN domain-containing protein [archaeon]
MNTYKQHFDLANERFQAAEDLLKKEKYHTAAHLFINAAINYHNALCQKFLNKIPSHKPHSDISSYFNELSRFLGEDSKKYRDAYEFLIANKSQADYGVYFSVSMAKQIERKANKIKEIAEMHL